MTSAGVTVFGFFKRKDRAQTTPPPAPSGGQVKVFLNPLVMLLAAREKQKGAGLTRDEVLAVRDNAKFILMSPEQATAFYAALDARIALPRIDPERVWEEWQELRTQIHID